MAVPWNCQSVFLSYIIPFISVDMSFNYRWCLLWRCGLKVDFKVSNAIYGVVPDLYLILYSEVGKFE